MLKLVRVMVEESSTLHPLSHDVAKCYGIFLFTILLQWIIIQIMLKPIVKVYPVTWYARHAGINQERLFKAQNGKCFYCHKPMARFTRNCTRDHLFPKAFGFTLCGNKILACRKCNNRKGCRMPSVDEIVKYCEVITTMNAGKEKQKAVLIVATNAQGKPRFRVTV